MTDWHTVHRYYMEHQKIHARDVARKFGVSSSGMYIAFQRLNLPKRDSRHPSRFNRQDVIELHRAYLADDSPIREFAKAHGINDQYMYALFQRECCTARRGRGRKPQEQNGTNSSPDGQCPQGNHHLFCLHCPCPPPCEDWHCPTCERAYNQTCACWSPRLRKRAGWQAAFDAWAHNRALKDEWRRHYESAGCDVFDAFKKGRMGWKQNRLAK